MSTQTQEIFISAIKDLESALTDIGFYHISTTKKGYATYFVYNSTNNTQVLFMYGPSDWNVEMIISKGETKYALKDLVQSPLIAQWISENNFRQQTGNDLKDQVAW